MLTVYTARMGFVGADALDVTRKSAGPEGIVFAPSWAILTPALDARKRAEALRAAARAAPEDPAAGWGFDEAEMLEADAWAAYVPAYLAEMRRSYRADRAAWLRLLARESVTLLCYCTDPSRCHRTLLALEILPKFGATYAGERSKQRGLFDVAGVA